MVQLDRSNDFVFDEAGGRGTPVGSFFRRLGKSHAGYNSNSGGSGHLDAGSARSSNDLGIDSRVVGASFSHFDGIREQSSSQNDGASRQRAREFLDLDDDWDADIDRNLAYDSSQKKDKDGRNDLHGHDGSSRALVNIEEILRDPVSSIYSGPTENGIPINAGPFNDHSNNAAGVSRLGLDRTLSESSVGSSTINTTNTYSTNNDYNGPALTPVTSAHSHDSSTLTFEKRAERGYLLSRFAKFKRVMEADNIDLEELRKLSWVGVSESLRPAVWMLLLGYLPTNSKRRAESLETKRNLYTKDLEQVFGKSLKQGIWHQINIDVPRTNPDIELYRHPTTQKMLERILYLWAIRNASSGYVQGINDLLTPFFQTFLSAYIIGDPETFDPSTLDERVLQAIEADSYWCLTKFMSGILNNYVEHQPGIHEQVAKLRTIMYRTKKDLVQYLEHENIQFMNFSFRWMNCLLMREVSLKITIRMWDTYLAVGADEFANYHVYVCAAFLSKWEKELMKMDFQELMIFLQSPPTEDWTDRDVEMILSEAWAFYATFEQASAHLR